MLRRKKKNTIAELNTGNMIKEKLEQQRISKAELARRIQRNQAIINKFLKRTSMEAYILWDISVGFNHNFFDDIADLLVKATPNIESSRADKKIIAALQKELDEVRRERDMLLSILKK